jgi:hypothetical protein
VPALAKKAKQKKSGDVIADATDRLLREVKRRMLREKGRVDYDQLTREGFSAAMISRLRTL